MLRQVNEDLIELATTQQVEIFNDLEANADVSNNVRLALSHDPESSVTSTNLELLQQI